MDVQSRFDKYYRRLKRIGIVKAGILSLCCGLLFTALAALITWFTSLSLLWVLVISLGGGLIAFGALFPILYFKVFAPSIKGAARAADKLGLDERAVTMFELSEDESYLSSMQRDDAKAALEKTDARRIPFSIPKIVIALSCFALIFAICMTTVSSLASVGRLARGYEYIFPPEDEENPEEEDKTEYVTVYYIAREHGTIEGEETQRIVKGGNTKTVRAVPEEGYQFLQWSDGILTPERRDWEVMEDMAVEAYFLQPSAEDQGDRESDEGEGKSPSEEEDKQGGQDDENGDPDSNEEGEGEDEDAEGDEQDQESEGDDETSDEDTAGSASADGRGDNNSVIDGQTDYKNEFDYEGSKEDVENDPEIPDDLKDLLSDYFDVLKP